MNILATAFILREAPYVSHGRALLTYDTDYEPMHLEIKGGRVCVLCVCWGSEGVGVGGLASGAFWFPDAGSAASRRAGSSCSCARPSFLGPAVLGFLWPLCFPFAGRVL